MLGPPTEGADPEDWGFDNTVKPPIRSVPGAGPQPGPQPGMPREKPGPGGIKPKFDPGWQEGDERYADFINYKNKKVK